MAACPFISLSTCWTGTQALVMMQKCQDYKKVRLTGSQEMWCGWSANQMDRKKCLNAQTDIWQNDREKKETWKEWRYRNNKKSRGIKKLEYGHYKTNN